jgi:predicted O-methyltransferase YrrM
MSKLQAAAGTSDEAEQFVAALYRGMLRREPDAQGLRTYAEALRNGRSHLAIVEEFLRSKEMQANAAVKLFVPPGHHCSPIVDPAEAAKHIDARSRSPLPDGLAGIALDRQQMIATWHSLVPFMTTAPFPEHEDRSSRYAYINPSYSFGDGSVLYAMLRLHRPKRVIEIGSGWSSACIFETATRDLGGDCRLTFIDPYPQLLKERLGKGASGVRIFASPVQEVPLAVFDELAPNDVLFIDSTHVLRTGSDVCFELFEILPRLQPGVIVHFHDMFWPFEYPRAWAVDENRSWNEVYAVRAFLTDNPHWRILFFNDYFVRYERPLIEATYPRFLKNPGGALWLQRL